MNESERLESLEKEIEILKLQINNTAKIMQRNPWETVRIYIETETLKIKTKNTREYWMFCESVRNAIRVSLGIKDVRRATEEQIPLAMLRAKAIIKAMDVTEQDTPY